MFQLENVIGMVEGFPHQTEPHGVNDREHKSSLSPRLWMPAPPRVPRYLWQVARKLLYHNPRTPAVSPADPLGHARRQRNVRAAGWEPLEGTGPGGGRVCELPGPRLKTDEHASEALSFCNYFGPNITDARNIQPLAQRTADSLSRHD